MSSNVTQHVPCEKRYQSLVYKETKEYEMFCRVLDKDRKQTLNELSQNERLFKRKYSALLSRRQRTGNDVTNEDDISRPDRLKRMLSFEGSRSSALQDRIKTFLERIHFRMNSTSTSQVQKEESDESTSEVYDLKKESIQKYFRKYGNNKLSFQQIRRSSFPVVRSKLPARRQSLYKSQYYY